jgi:hypothetical protein
MNPSPYPAPFNSAHSRANWVKILLIVGAVVTGASMIVEALSIAFPLRDDQELGDNLMGAAVGLIMLGVGLLELVLVITTAVFFLMWLYRAHKNLPVLNPGCRLHYSAGMAVGSFFIPFANLIVPYRAVKEVWQKSGAPGEAFLSEPKPPAIFPLWWIFWLLASFSGNISTRMSFDDTVPASNAAIASIIAGILSMVAAGFAWFVVDSIDKRQEETSAKVHLGNFSGPPPPPPDLQMLDVVAPSQG